MSVVPRTDFEFISAQLEDTQESLIAALARIEIFRAREKKLIAEIAKLQLIGSTPAKQQQQDSSADATPPEQQPQQAAVPPEHEGQAADKPAYITEVEGHLPVMLINSAGHKTPGSIVITHGFIDFVEVRARIKRRDFVGFCAAPAAAAAGAAAGLQTPPHQPAALWKQCLPCLSPEPHSPTAAARRSRHADAEAAAADGRHPASAGAAPAAGQGTLPGASSALEAAGAGSRPGEGAAQAWGGSGKTSSSGGGAAAAFINSSSDTGTWQILWQGGGQQRKLAFEATQQARELLHRHTRHWVSHNGADDAAAADGDEGLPPAAGSSSSAGEGVELAVPRLLVPGPLAPVLSEPSCILAASSTAAGPGPAASAECVTGLEHLAAALPRRFQGRPWTLLYSTARHGISLATLYRRAAGSGPSLLLVRDTGGYVFGAFTTEAWRPAPRFFGTGETFVFQLAPHKLLFPWLVKARAKNDFFMYAQPDALAVGGLGAFAIWLDAELLQGSSGNCGTFGSPCLSCKEEFRVAAVELWGV